MAVERLMFAYLRVVPGFWIAVEERDRPAIQSQPVVMGGLPHQRGIVREANLLAQRCGIRPGMTLSQAQQYCPDGLFLVPNLARYGSIWDEICELLRLYTPLVEPIEMGQAVCDLTGCERLWGDERETARAIALQVRENAGIVPWLGIASNRLTAQLASTVADADGGRWVPLGQERTFLADFPLSSLPEVDERLALTFEVLGLRTVGQLATLPPSAIERRFGAVGKRLHAYARGVDERPVVPPPARPSVSVRLECDEGTVEETLDLLSRLVGQAAAELRRRSLAGKLVELSLEWEPSPVFGPARQRYGSGASLAEEAAPAPAATALAQDPRQDDSQVSLPVPYRIQSMLPQPSQKDRGWLERPKPLPLDGTVEPHARLVEAGSGRGPLPSQRLRVAVRTPIDSAPPLLERTRELIVRSWPRDAPSCRLHALQLTISEFEPPTQLAFAEMNRLDQVGALGGESAERRQTLRRQEEVLIARYGTNPFRHLAQTNPDSILTERRFRWQAGLPWNGSGPGAGKGRKRTGRRS